MIILTSTFCVQSVRSYRSSHSDQSDDESEDDDSDNEEPLPEGWEERIVSGSQCW